jgi:hypothetical protein
VNVTIRIPSAVLTAVRRDLDRPHAHAWERVGFLAAAAMASQRGLLLLVRGYQPVEDGDYVRAKGVGAEIGSEAFRKALQWAYRTKSALLHIHTHHGTGRPSFSGVDMRSGAKFVPSFFTTLPAMPHGMVVLSGDSAEGLIWLGEDRDPDWINAFTQVGTNYSRNWSEQ